jgi:hypothetical protein
MGSKEGGGGAPHVNGADADGNLRSFRGLEQNFGGLFLIFQLKLSRAVHDQLGGVRAGDAERTDIGRLAVGNKR